MVGLSIISNSCIYSGDKKIIFNLSISLSFVIILLTSNNYLTLSSAKINY